MFALKFLIFLISIFLPGYILVKLVLGKYAQGWLKSLSLSFALGSLFITVQLFIILFLLKLSLGNWIFIIFLLENLLLLFLYYNKYGWRIEKIGKIKQIKLKEVLLFSLIIIQILFVLFSCLSKPIITYDSLALWTMRSKVLYQYGPSVFFDPNSLYYLGNYSHSNYPWHSSLLQYWAAFNLNDFHESVINLIFLIFFISILLLLYSYLRDYISRFYSLIFTFLLSSLPLFLYHASSPYSDLPLSYYVLIGFIFLLKWIEYFRKNKVRGLNDKTQKSLLFWTGFFFGASFLVKLDAIIFIISACLVVLSVFGFEKKLFNKFFKDIIWFILGLVLPAIFWAFFLLHYNLGLSNVAPGFGWHPEIFKPLFAVFFVASSWNIWWFVFFVFSLIYIKIIWKEKELLWGYYFLFITAFGFLALYLFTNQYEFVVDNTAVSRNILLFIPSSVFLIAKLFYKSPRAVVKK